jgi:hypothetical protein
MSNGTSNPIPTDTGFDGFPTEWYYLDRTRGTLSASFPSSAQMSTAQNPLLSVAPRYLNAPDAAVGSNSKTQFKGQGKPNAYLKVQVTQDQAGASTTEPMTWAAMYPITDSPNDDIGSKYFGDPVSGDPVQKVPIPGGTGRIFTPLTAVVGGPETRPFLNIIGQVLGIATGTAGKALFPIPSADIALASNVENLLNLASSTFARTTKQQYWINPNGTPITVSSTSVGQPDAINFASGTTFMAAFPTGDNDVCLSALSDIISNQSYVFDVDRGGQLVALHGGSVVTPNPFANLIYATFRVTVSS